MMKPYANLLLIPIVITLAWEASPTPDVTSYKLYARASTESAFHCISTMHRQLEVKITVDGRRNWFLYVTAKNSSGESAPSNIVYVPR